MDEEYEVRRSARRKKTMTAFREGGRLIVVVPQRLTAQQQRELVPGLVTSFLAKERQRSAPRGERELTERARALYASLFSPEVPALGVRWVTNQEQRWGSCTTSTGEIRLSDRLQPMPDWVVDYVLVHELAHLIEHGHNARFHQLVARYADAERAKAFLAGYELGRRR